jgi:hypothetical protein
MYETGQMQRNEVVREGGGRGSVILVVVITSLAHSLVWNCDGILWLASDMRRDTSGLVIPRGLGSKGE